MRSFFSQNFLTIVSLLMLQKLNNLEELRINCGGEDCDLTNDGMIALFTLPYKEPEKSFPYKLKHLEIAHFHPCRTSLLQAINQKYVDFFCCSSFHSSVKILVLIKVCRKKLQVESSLKMFLS